MLATTLTITDYDHWFPESYCYLFGTRLKHWQSTLYVGTPSNVARSRRGDDNDHLTNAKACVCVASTKESSKHFTRSNIMFTNKLIQLRTSYPLDEGRVTRYEGIGKLAATPILAD